MDIKSFIVVKNDKKANETHPEYKAMYKPEGSEFWIELAGGWVKEKEDGSKFMSFKMADYREWEYEGKKHWRDGFTIKQDNKEAVQETPTQPKQEDTINPDDIPF